VIITELEEIAARERQNSARVGLALRVQTIDAGYDLPEKGELVDALKPVYARRSLPWAVEAFRSHSDANQLWAAGVKPILLGPGRLEMAHAPDESIPFRQVVLASEIYLDLLEALCFSKG
jgi:acetylornithine deacetylase